MSLANPFTAVSRETFDALEAQLATAKEQLSDAESEAASFRGALEAEVRNGERLTDLAARAVLTAQIYKQVLIERQVGKQGDPSKVIVANLPPAPRKQEGFVPLRKRRRLAMNKDEADQVRRNALPKLVAELPNVPLTAEDRDAMREAVAELSKEKT